VFAKEDFNILPEHRQWDHAIELILGSEPKSSKVYPLSPVEQKELDSFLEENLCTGRIRPSKSPMAALVFFIKKKDSSLWLVQVLSQSLDDLGTTLGECLGRTRWSSPLDSTTYLYNFTSDCTPITTQSHVLPEHSMIT